MQNPITYVISYIDITIVCVYLIACILIGFFKRGVVRNIKEYTIGGSGYPTIVLVATIFATNIGAGSTIGAIEKVYTMGILFVLAQLTEPLLWLISSLIFPKGIEYFKGCISLSDIMEKLYSNPGRWVVNFSYLFFSIGVIAAQVTAIGNVFSYFFNISHLNGVFIGFSVLVIYSVLGGIRAVALTDVIQFFIFYVAIPLACANALNSIGGINGFIKNIPESTFHFNITKENIALLLSMCVYFIMPQISGSFIQRFLMAETGKKLRKTLYIITLIHIPLVIIICFIGLIMKIADPNIKANFIAFYFIQNYLPIGLSGLLIAGLLSVIMSTTDSFLNTTGVLVAHDIIKKIYPQISDKQELMIARISVIGVSLLAIVFAVKFQTIINILWMARNFWDPICLVPVVAGMLGFRTHYISFIISVIVAIFTTIITGYLQGEFATVSMCSGILGSALGLFISHYLFVYYRSTLTNAFIKTSKFLALKHGIFKLLISNQENKISYSYNNHYNMKTEYYLFSIFIIITYSMPLFIGDLDEHHHCTEIIYFIAITLCGILCTFSYWPISWRQKYLKFYWYITLLYCLPCISSYILLITNVSSFWILKFTLATFLLAILVKWKIFVVLFILGVVLGYILYLIFHLDQAIHLPSRSTYIVGYLYALIAFIGIVFIRSRDTLIGKKLILEQFFANYIAKQIQSPLLNIKHIASSVSSFSNEIKENTEEFYTNNEKQYKVSLPKKTYNNLFKTLSENFETYSKETKRITESLLSSMKNTVYGKSLIKLNICPLLTKIIEDYGFSESDKYRLIVKRNFNFSCRASEHHMKQTIFNILQFIFSHIGKSDKVIIKLNDNSISFESNNMLLHSEDVFDNFKIQIFAEDAEVEIGSNLSYCKAFMQSIGGDFSIYCSYRESIKITLNFPLCE